MARRVFISFRFSDGEKYKTKLCELFDGETKVINCSENEDRSGMSEETIQKYLYSKLKTTSVTIIIITPQAINHKKDMWGDMMIGCMMRLDILLKIERITDVMVL